MPSRLLRAFPAGVPVHRVPLDQAIARVEQFLPVPGRIDPLALERLGEAVPQGH
jgi:hypothetical protein